MNDLKLNLDKIKARAPKVYDQLIGALALAGFHIFDGRSEVTLNEAQWRKLSALHGELIPVLQAIVNEHEKFCGCSDCFNKRVAEQIGSEKDRLALVAQAKAAAARLTQYLKGEVAGVGRLRDSENNRQQWTAFEKKLPADVVLSAGLIDQFISGWRSVLEFDVTPAPAPAPPAPAVVILSDGSEQLPIDAIPDRKHTVVQLRDLDTRQRALKAGEGVLAPLENGEPRLLLGTKPSPSHSVAQRRDLELRTARAWARQQGSVGGSFFSNDWQVR